MFKISRYSGSFDLAKAVISAPILFVLASCGGSSGSTANYASSYAATLANNEVLLVILQKNGSAFVEISNSSGILASGSGSVSGSKLNVPITGQGGTFQVNTTFGSSHTANSQVSTNGNTVTVSDELIAGAGASPFAGTIQVNYSGTASGTSSCMITSTGALSGTGISGAGANDSFSGATLPTGSTTFSGVETANGGSTTVTFTGSLYLFDLNNTSNGVSFPGIVGQGTWSTSSGASGTWTAANVA